MGKVRDLRIDGAKGCLIFLVVLGHLLEGMNRWDADTVRIPLTAIYAFHMPAFVFLAGVTAKATMLGRRIGTLLVLLVAFHALYYGFTTALGEPVNMSWRTPYWILWFLLAMCGWLLSLPAVRRAPRIAVVVSVVISIVIGTVSWIGYPFTLSRALVFLPFFVVGATYGTRIVSWLGNLPMIAKATMGLLGVGAIAGVLEVDLRQAWFYGSRGFEDLDVSTVDGLLTRSLLLVMAALLTSTVIAFIPNKPSAMAEIGRRSMPVYLLHGFVVIAVTPYLPEMLRSNSLVAAGIAVVIAAGALLLCSRPWVDETLRRFGAALPNMVTSLLKHLRSGPRATTEARPGGHTESDSNFQARRS